MLTPGTTAEPAVAADSDLTSALDRAEETISARGGEDEGDEAPAAPAPAPKQEAKPKAEPEKRKPQAGGIAALAAREWKAQQREKELDAREGRLKPLEQLVSKKDVRGLIELLGKEHGMTFAHVVDVLTDDKPEPEKTPAEIAREAAQEELRKAREADAKEREAEHAKQVEAKVAGIRARLAEMAESGTAEDPNRWELTAVAGKAAEAWDLIERWHAETGESLKLEDALDRVETKMRAKQEARRPKVDAGKPTAGGKARNEAATKKPGGRVVVPSFTNRKTSGVPAAVASDEDDDETDDDLTDNAAIDRAARRAGIRLS